MLYLLLTYSEIVPFCALVCIVDFAICYIACLLEMVSCCAVKHVLYQGTAVVAVRQANVFI